MRAQLAKAKIGGAASRSGRTLARPESNEFMYQVVVVLVVVARVVVVVVVAAVVSGSAVEIN